ncbi:response regulator transcription factor [Oscillospiraceae bacterium MB08-C2-2]|nr:response regulator transcription factor [Oscillospiraceae bacterium MB08-C2-2]
MRILMIEDDPDLCEIIGFALTREGYTLDLCSSGDEGLEWLRQQAHDLVLLDRMLPGTDGVTLLKMARQEGITTPVLMMTALGQIHERVEGLDSGADDYIVKPFAVEELLARIRAMNRRPRSWEGEQRLSQGDVVFDPMQKSLECGDTSCSLSKREADLLEILLKNFGQVLPRSTLFARVWGPYAEVEDGNLENYIHFIRKRLRSVGSRLNVVTVRGVGYCVEDGDV